MLLTEQSRRAIHYAQVEAGAAGSKVIDPEHLLRAVLRDDHSSARTVLREQGATPGAIYEEVSAHRDASLEQKVPMPPEQVTLSPESLSTMELAASVAARFGREYVGPEHILIALVVKPTPILMPIWERYNVSFELPPQNKCGEIHLDGESHSDIAPVFADEADVAWSECTFAAQKAVHHARDEAIRSGFNAIPAVFLASGILQDVETVAHATLKRCGVERNLLREALVDILPTGTGFDSRQSVKFDADSIQLIREASRLSTMLKDRHIGTEHLFLALLADPGEAGALLRANGVVTANFLDALRHVKRGKRVEAEKIVYTPAEKIMWLFLIVVILGWLWLAFNYR